MAQKLGSITVSFGAAPGTNKVSAAVTGLTSLVNTDYINAWISGSDSTSDHTSYEHAMAPIRVRVTNPISGVGFTIEATSEHRLTGDFKVRYAYTS